MYKSQRENRVISKSVEQVNGTKRKRTIVRRRINADPSIYTATFLSFSLSYGAKLGRKRDAKSAAVLGSMVANVE